MDIKVILETGDGLDIDALSKEERDILFDHLSKEVPDIPAVIFECFSEMLTESIEDKSRRQKPDLKELLVRAVIKNSSDLRGKEGINTSVVPIIKSHSGPIHGGAAPHKPRPKGFRNVGFGPANLREQSIREESPSEVKVKFDQRIFAVTTLGREYIAGPGEDLIIVGLMFNPLCKPIMVPLQTSTSGVTHATPSTTVGTPGFIKSREVRPNRDMVDVILGNYTYQDLSLSCNIGAVGSAHDAIVNEVFMFTGDDDIVLERLFNYLVNLMDIKTSIGSAMLVYMYLRRLYQKYNGPMRFLKPQVAPKKTTLQVLPKEETLVRMEAIGLKFSTEFRLAVLADIYGRGLASAYCNAVLRGVDHSAFLDELEVYKQKRKSIQFHSALQAKNYDRMVKLNIYRLIIEKKLGHARALEIERVIARKPGSVTKPEGIIQLLHERERKPIQVEFDKRMKYTEEVLNNKCAHVLLYKKLRAPSRTFHYEKKIWEELKGFFVPTRGQSSSMIQCKVCKFDIICPHIVELTELEFAGKTSAEIKSRMTKYIDTAVVKDQYYCKICGEMVSSLEAFDDVSSVRDPDSNIDTELNNFIWGEVASLIKYLRFEALVDVPSIITHIRDVIYPYIFEIEKNIIKSRTNTADEIKAKKRLSTTIYALAYMIHLVISSGAGAGASMDTGVGGKAKRKVSIGFRGVAIDGKKNPVVELVKHALNTIVLVRNVAIREIPGMTTEIIKSRLIEAFKVLQQQETAISVKVNSLDDIIISLNADPIYHYLCAMLVVTGILKASPRDENDLELIEDVLGVPVKGLATLGDIYKKVPDIVKTITAGMFRDSSGPAASSALTVDRGGWLNYIAASYNYLMKTIKSRLFDRPKFVSMAVTGTSKIGDIIEARLDEKHEEDDAIFHQIKKTEDALYRKYQQGIIQSNVTIPSANAAYFRNPKTHLGRIFDEEGNAHVFNILLIQGYGDDAGKIVEIKTADLVKAAETTAWKGKIVDKKCSVCGIIRSKCETLLDEKKIHDAINAKNLVGNFFRFYENRCPKGALHDFEVDKGSVGADESSSGAVTKCKKCSMDIRFILGGKSIETKEALLYFKEYKSFYFQEKHSFEENIKQDITEPETAPLPALSEKLTDEQKASLDAWTPNFNLVLELATRLKINHRLLSALGSIEKIEYAEVQSGKFISPEAEYHYDTRVFVLIGYIKNFVTEYNQLRYYHKLFHPPSDLTAVIEAGEISRSKYSQLETLLPDLTASLNERIEYVQRTKKPRDCVLFMIQELCELCLRLLEPDVSSAADTKKLRSGFVQYFITKLLREEEMLTKPGYFSWTLVYGEKESKEVDTNYEEDEDEETVPLGMENKAELAEAEEEVAMNMDGFDVDEDPDNEPDDTGNEIRVEGFGLD
jgi:hypothetical protein